MLEAYATLNEIRKWLENMLLGRKIKKFFNKLTYLSCSLFGHCQVGKILLTASTCPTEFHHFYVSSGSCLTYNSLRLPYHSFCSHPQQKFETLLRVSQIFNILCLTKCIHVNNLSVLFWRPTFGFYSILCFQYVSRIGVTDTSIFRVNKLGSEGCIQSPWKWGQYAPQTVENNQIFYTVLQLQNRRHFTNKYRESEICALLGIYAE
jgi:hypothetical protein